jgi:hypothetical protein
VRRYVRTHVEDGQATGVVGRIVALKVELGATPRLLLRVESGFHARQNTPKALTQQGKRL